MKIKIVLPQFLAILSAIILMASCEEGIGTIGSEIIGDQNVNATLDDTKSIVAYSRLMLPVQSNQLPIYQMGVYSDPTFGSSTIDLLTQVTLEETNPSFGEGTVLDSVVLYMPFFSEATTDDEGDISYTLDSIYSGNSPINISIFESEYFLRIFDPNTGFEETQNYYANQGPLFKSFKGELVHTIENFTPSTNGYTTLEITDDDADASDTLTTQLSPGIRVMLQTEYFVEKIIEQEGTANLINNINFTDYLRGFYFEMEGQGDNLSKYDISNAKIDLHFTAQNDPVGADGELSDERYQGLLTLNFGTISVNAFENQLPPEILQNLFDVNTTDGEEILYVRGGAGIISVLELFGDDNDGNGVADELDQMRQEKWLINEANLILYVDKDNVTGGGKEPERLLIYDLNNNSALIDYALDITSGDEPINSYNTHLGRLERGSDGNGDFYKIRITNHLSNLIHQDSTNVAIGLVISQNVGEPGFQDLENEQAPGIEQIPASSVVAHEGTVIHGNTSTNQARRLKLQIYYTESN